MFLTNVCYNGFTEADRESDKLLAKLQELRTRLEAMQNQQAEDSRGISRQQKNTERYLAKKQMLSNRKDDCNRNIRDLGVLPEEAFEKYMHENPDRVRRLIFWHDHYQLTFPVVNEEASFSEWRFEEICSCEQKGIWAVQ